MMRVVLLLPPKDYWRILVSFESRYGTCSFFSDVRALMTFPRQLRDLLMFLASSSCWPLTPVLETFSEPAKSTKYNLAFLLLPFLVSFCPTCTINSEWLLELRSFMPVKATLLFSDPFFIVLRISATEATYTSVQSWIKMPRVLSSLTSSLFFDGSSKSIIFSLYISIYEHLMVNYWLSSKLSIFSKSPSIILGISPFN